MTKVLHEVLLYSLDLTWFHGLHVSKLLYHAIAELIWVEVVLGELGVSLKLMV
jgi:hypothetical protein